MSGIAWGTSFRLLFANNTKRIPIPVVITVYEFRFAACLLKYKNPNDIERQRSFYDTRNIDAVRSRCEGDGGGEDEHPANPRPGSEMIS